MNLFPDSDTLIKILSSFHLAKKNKKVFIHSRKAFINVSTFPAEVITCNVRGGKKIKFFLKYINRLRTSVLEYRGVMDYEGIIYRDVIQEFPFSKPKYIGHYSLPEMQITILILQYLSKANRLGDAQNSNLLLKESAKWIGKFHKWNAHKIFPDIIRYDEKFYIALSEKIQEFTLENNAEYRWINSINEFFFRNINLLTTEPQIIIHGEYYPRNILIQKNKVYPVDWESAAISAGEIDLASLIEGWKKKHAKKAIEGYKLSRWQHKKNVPQHFEKRFLLAQIYFQLRWLSEFSTEWLQNPKEFKILYKLGKKAGCF